MDMQRVIGMSLMSRIFLRDWLKWRCRMQKNSLKFLVQPKTRGNNMKTPFLSSFCLSDFRTVIRFLPKNLVPEILNLLTLVVCNCTSAKPDFPTQTDIVLPLISQFPIVTCQVWLDALALHSALQCCVGLSSSYTALQRLVPLIQGAIEGPLLSTQPLQGVQLQVYQILIENTFPIVYESFTTENKPGTRRKYSAVSRLIDLQRLQQERI